MAAEDNSWRTQAFRQSVVSKIDEAIQRSGLSTSRNSVDMENHIFQKVKTREEYLGLVARLILHIREICTTKMQDPGGQTPDSADDDSEYVATYFGQLGIQAMDLTVVISICAAAVLISLSILLYIKTGRKPKANNADQQQNRPAENAPRRAQVVRNQRARLRANAARHEVQEDNQEEAANPELPEGFDEKMGAKKRAKLEAKAEKKAQREIEEKAREEKKKREQALDEERLKQQEKDAAEEKRKEEEEKRAREEKEKREHEEYLKMKEAFSVEEEGYEEEEQEGNTLQDFINYIKQNKVIVIEDLAAHFKLKTQAAIDRIQDLQNDNSLSGVIDDRGKFIYVSQEELEAVAKFIKQRGRVSITELAESSNKLIDLNPSKMLLT